MKLGPGGDNREGIVVKRSISPSALLALLVPLDWLRVVDCLRPLLVHDWIVAVAHSRLLAERRRRRQTERGRWRPAKRVEWFCVRESGKISRTGQKLRTTTWRNVQYWRLTFTSVRNLYTYNNNWGASFVQKEECYQQRIYLRSHSPYIIGLYM